MHKLGFEDIRFDSMGNTLGRIGDGPRILLYDSHIDTVGIGDPAEWQWDPFTGKVEDAASCPACPATKKAARRA